MTPRRAKTESHLSEVFRSNWEGRRFATSIRASLPPTHQVFGPGSSNPLSRAGLSLIEILIAVSILGILAAAVLTLAEPNLHDRLVAVAQIVTADLEYSRSLAVSHASHYTLTFDVNANRYTLSHSGSNSALDTLPTSPYRQPSDLPTQQTTDLATLPTSNGVVQLAAVQKSLQTPEDVTSLEFGPLGSTTRAEATVIWLSVGEGDAKRYLSIEVDPIVGLTTTSETQTEPPLGQLISM